MKLAGQYLMTRLADTLTKLCPNGKPEIRWLDPFPDLNETREGVASATPFHNNEYQF